MLTRILSKVALAVMVGLLAGCQGGVLDPKGQVGIEEKQLIIVATLLMLLVVIPVIFMTLYFAWKYREGRDEIYEPKWSHSTKIETVVWAIPIVIVIILARDYMEIDPRIGALTSRLNIGKEHIKVQVIVDELEVGVYISGPRHCNSERAWYSQRTRSSCISSISSEGTMNSFFIPQLGSQIYAMAGMVTKLHLIANEPGTFDGISANYSGAGFTGMKFECNRNANRSGF